MSGEPRIGIVGATGAVGTVTLGLLSQRGYTNVRAFASSRSAGGSVAFGDRKLQVEEATPDALAAGELDIVLFSVGTAASRELVPHAVRGGAIAVDKSSAYRLEPGIPLVVPEVNGARALANDAANLEFVFAEKRLDRASFRHAMLGVNTPFLERLLGFEFDDRNLLAVGRDESLV